MKTYAALLIPLALASCVGSPSASFHLVSIGSDCRILYDGDKPYTATGKKGQLAWGVGKGCKWNPPGEDFFILKAQSIDVSQGQIARVLTNPNKDKGGEVRKVIIRRQEGMARRNTGPYRALWSTANP